MLTRQEIEKIKSEFATRLAQLDLRLAKIDQKTETRLIRTLTGAQGAKKKAEKSNKKLTTALAALGYDPALIAHLNPTTKEGT